ncbi:DoxX family protein [Halorarum salinum]|uniref:DoxX family protein n=1 Tax=Halorarum salinum TaxID=2743089 RepID=A0A7D5QGT2_9EURY|nr:DoxX family protein [Halobaculum salinum]QLG61704.1 DoxX family protein [Halobaculum salinum]
MPSADALDQFDAVVTRYDRLAGVLLRGGLGVTILLAGGHKLVAPAAWHAYLAPPFAALWPTGLLPLSPTFVLFGVSEVLFGLLLLADWHTPTVASVTALSLLGVVVNLCVGVAVGEPYVDVLVRDVGLTFLAFGVALNGDTARGAGDGPET